jgi:hypothetical protein
VQSGEWSEGGEEEDQANEDGGAAMGVDEEGAEGAGGGRARMVGKEGHGLTEKARAGRGSGGIAYR